MKTLEESVKSGLSLGVVVLSSLWLGSASLQGAQTEESSVAPAGGERVLALEGAKKELVRHSMIGIRDTVIFYTLAAQKAVLVLGIDNGSAAFTASGTVFLFASETTEEGLGKWVNNQHSDGLFEDAPVPVLSLKLPDGSCTVTDRKLVGEEKNPTNDEVFSDYLVKVSVKEHRVEGKFRLAAFEDKANVYLKK